MKLEFVSTRTTNSIESNGNYSNEIIIKSSGDNQKLEMISELVL
jgi:hypothetical protein